MNITANKHLDEELRLLKQVWELTGYSPRDVDRGLSGQRKQKAPQGTEEEEEDFIRGYCGSPLL